MAITPIMTAPPAVPALPGAVPAAPAAPGAARPTSLASGIAAVLAASPLGPVTSMSVRDAQTGATLIAHDDVRPVAPGSNEKLATADAALRVLGPGTRFLTRLSLDASPDAAGIVHGNARLIGGGDPALSVNDLDRFARQLAADGVTRIDGRVIGDESLLDTTRAVPGWIRAASREARPLGALTIAEDATGVHVPGVQMPEPAAHAAGVMHDLLERRGITVGDAELPSPALATGTTIMHASPPVRDIAAFMLRKSSSTTAEILTRQIGRVGGAAPTTEAGAQVIAQGLPTPAGPAAPVVHDGSGLHAGDRTTTRDLTNLLVRSEQSPDPDVRLHDLLAVAGETGTIAHRMTGPDTAGRVHAKTGTLREASALSGYVDRTDGRELAFSVIVSPIDTTQLAAARALQDALAGVLATAPISVPQAAAAH